MKVLCVDVTLQKPRVDWVPQGRVRVVFRRGEQPRLEDDYGILAFTCPGCGELTPLDKSDMGQSCEKCAAEAERFEGLA